ncbi:MAG: dTMP kinase, partial [Candidatus Cloacimonadota bacterium]|nr:dTMP kinase [Candidatus Cloacimonadota bacterium]
MRGIFVTFEGGEGCGKSTQSKLLKEFLEKEGYPTFLTREPGGPKISEEIRDMLLDKSNSEMHNRTEVLLYSASRAQHTAQWILPKLEDGQIVISDRYYDSTSAYQGAARLIGKKDIEMLNEFATFEIVPDITFLIDLDHKKGLNRIDTKKIDRLESESFEFHQRVRKGFLKIA